MKSVAPKATRRRSRLIDDSHPDLIAFNPLLKPSQGTDLMGYIKTNPATKNVPLILLSQEPLSQERLRRT